jgi:prepilin-type N-terminal cleavage/methylation domain-containing protein
MIRSSRRRAPLLRRGMTLVEVVVAVTILTGAVLGMAGFIAKFGHTVSTVRERERAGQLATERLEEVKSGSPYDSLAARYARVETAIPGYGGLTRTTTLTRVGGPTATMDYVVVTVEVVSARLEKAVRKTTVISQF